MKNKLNRLWLLLAAAAICLSCVSCTVEIASAPQPQPQQAYAGDELEVHFIDVGQADCALLMCGGESLLIDGGNVQDSSRVVTYLKKQGISHIDYVVCTHGHEDHVGGLSGALSTFTAGKVISSCEEYDSKAFGDFVKYTEKQGLRVEEPEPGDAFELGDAQITLLGPVKEYEEENDNSVVLRADIGESSFLFTGDMEAAAEADLIASGAYLEADVLKVGHHGSSTSSSYRFLREVMPEVGVISCGADNSYGHPHDEILSRLRDAEVQLYRTDLQGDIVAVTDGGEITFTTAKNSAKKTNPAQEDAAYIGNRRSKVFHREGCESLPKEENRVRFETRGDALDAGFSPCGGCNP